jgi:peptide/nickel transport system permease protein
LATVILCIPIAIILGVISATHKDKLPDHITRLIALSGVAMPPFWLGILLQLVLAYWAGIFPVGGRIDIELTPTHITGMYLLDSLLTLNGAAFLSALSHILLPATVLTFGILATLVRMTRSSMLDFLSHDSIRTARAMGLSNRKVIYKYALKNAILPTTTHIGMSFGTLFGYTVLVEQIFVYPGLGKYITDAILYLDYPGIIGATIVLAFLVLIVNLIVDFAYCFLNPRIRYG